MNGSDWRDKARRIVRSAQLSTAGPVAVFHIMGRLHICKPDSQQLVDYLAHYPHRLVGYYDTDVMIWDVMDDISTLLEEDRRETERRHPIPA